MCQDQMNPNPNSYYGIDSYPINVIGASKSMFLSVFKNILPFALRELKVYVYVYQ